MPDGKLIFFAIVIALTLTLSSKSWAERPIKTDPVEIYESLPGKIEFTNFNDKGQWTAGGSGAFDYSNRRFPIIGNRHFSAITGSNGKPSYLHTTSQSGPVDGREFNVAILMRIDTFDRLRNFDILIGDLTLENHWRYNNLRGYQAKNWFAEGRWVLYTFPLNRQSTKKGRPDIERIESIRLELSDDSKGELKYHVQTIALYRKADLQPVSIMFDTGHQSVIFQALPLLSRAKMPASVAMSHKTVGAGGLLSATQLKSLQNKYLWEIAARTKGNNLPEAGYEKIQNYLRSSKRFWEANKINIRGLVFGGGRYGAIANRPETSLVDLVKQDHFLWARSVNGAVHESVPVADPFKLRSIYVTSRDTPKAVIRRMVDTLNSGGWPILVFHRLTSGKAEKLIQYNINDFRTIISFLHRKGIKVKTPSQVILAANGI